MEPNRQASSTPASTPSWLSPGPPPAANPVDEQSDYDANERLRARSGALYLVASSVLHLLSIPVVLLFTKALVETVAGRRVEWSELFDLPIIRFGIILPAVLAGGSMVGASRLWNRPSWIAYAMINLGAVGIVFSVVLHRAYGFMGVLGGVLAMIGGVEARPKKRPTDLRRLPPPLRRSSPPAGPPETR